jgi:uncharacterized lipoprotein YmbA
MQQDETISPVVRTEQGTTQPSSRNNSSVTTRKQDSVNITPFVTQPAGRIVENGAKELPGVGESTSSTVFATPASQRAQTSS